MRPASRMIAPAQHYSWDDFNLMMTVAETARLLRCTEKTVREMLRAGTLYGIRTGHQGGNIMLVYIITLIIAICTVAWLAMVVVQLIRDEITCRKITIYREDKDGNLVERRGR